MGITAFPFTAVIDVPSARILGRDDAGTGAAEALTNTEIFAILGTGTPSASTYLRGDGTWAAVSAGISSLNGLTDATQTFAVGTSGTDVAFVSSAGVHTLNIPSASATARGVVTTGTQTFAGAKTFSSKITAPATGNSSGGIGSGGNGVDFYQGVILYIVGNGAAQRTPFYFALSTTVGNFPHLKLASDVVIGWESGFDATASPAPAATRIARWENYHVTVRSGANPCVFSVTNTYTSDTSYERLILSWASNVCYIGTEKGSAGGTARDLTLGTDGAVRLVLPAATTSGALYLGPRADNTATGGNARGANAVDLSTTRSAATQVASGSRSFVAPCGGTASGIGSISLSGIATGANSISHGNSVTTASGAFAVVFCSYYTGVSGNQSFACCGDFLTVSGVGAFGHGTIPGIGGATVAGRYSVGVAGGGTTTGGDNAFAHGPSAVSRLRGMRAFASGRFAANGDVQGAEIVLRNTTTTDSAVTLFVNGSSEQLTIPSGKILHATVHILGSKSDGTAVANYMRQVCIKNVGGTTSLVGTVNTLGTDEAAGTSIAITADDTNDALEINVTGILNETWRWVAVVYGVEIAYGT